MAILIYCLLVILGATTEITSGATFAIPTFTLFNADCFHAIRVDSLGLHRHVALLDFSPHNHRDVRLVPLVLKSARSNLGAHMASSKLLLARMAEFDERAVLKLLKVAWAHKQLPAILMKLFLVVTSMITRFPCLKI